MPTVYNNYKMHIFVVQFLLLYYYTLAEFLLTCSGLDLQVEFEYHLMLFCTIWWNLKQSLTPPLYSYLLQSLFTPEFFYLPEGDNVVYLLISVFSYLDIGSLLEAGRVCRTWHCASQHPAVLRNLTVRNKTLTSQVSLLALILVYHILILFISWTCNKTTQNIGRYFRNSILLNLFKHSRGFVKYMYPSNGFTTFLVQLSELVCLREQHQESIDDTDC